MGQFETAAVALLGLVFAVFVLIALAAAFVVRLRAHWARIAVRVAGSWIAASGLLMLGWAVRKGKISPRRYRVVTKRSWVMSRCDRGSTITTHFNFAYSPFACL